MKTTRFFLVSLITLISALFLTSCNKTKPAQPVVLTPEECAVEIDDAFRMNVAVGVMYVAYYEQIDEEEGDAFGDAIDEYALKVVQNATKQHYAKYKRALEMMRSEYYLAAPTLEIYETIEPSFTDWKKAENEDGHSVWLATEQNANIDLKFVNNEAFEWELYLDDDMYRAFLEQVHESLNEDEIAD